MDKSREQFEEAFEEITGWEAEDYPNEDYVDTLWRIWQASRAAAEVEIPEVEKWRSPEAVRAQRAMLVLVKQAISGAGIKVKGE
ncbi:hypothetical protein [Cronobacter dublinensis]|uniref:hypothetical protein n=1 Tax=Cronobacter dublinensis TaxID=413497 RepID=UPI00300DFE5F